MTKNGGGREIRRCFIKQQQYPLPHLPTPSLCFLCVGLIDAFTRGIKASGNASLWRRLEAVCLNTRKKWKTNLIQRPSQQAKWVLRGFKHQPGTHRSPLAPTPHPKREMMSSCRLTYSLTQGYLFPPDYLVCSLLDQVFLDTHYSFQNKDTFSQFLFKNSMKRK